MPTKRFTFNNAGYQDISEGYSTCMFRLKYKSQQDNGLRVILDATLPTVDDNDFDSLFAPGEKGDVDEFSFTGLTTTERAYVMAVASSSIAITVYRR